MFPRASRLHTTQEILTVFRRGEKIRRGALTLYYLPHSETRVTVIVDTKLSKKAVVRNKLKRQLRTLLKQAELPQGHIIARGYAGLEKELYATLRLLLHQCLDHPRIRSQK